jgi:hypothetical protein
MLDTSKLIAVNTTGDIMNVNLFFSSWMAFIMAMMLAADVFPAMLMADRVSTFTYHWMGFGTAALIAMANAVVHWQEYECKSVDDSNMCHRDLFAFIMGAVSGLFALFFFFFTHEMLEQVLSATFLAAWSFGVAYLTFDDGPATHIGSFYFSVWFAFMFALWMAVHSVVATWNGMGSNATSEETTTPATGESKAQEATAKHDAEEDQEKEETV